MNRSRCFSIGLIATLVLVFVRAAPVTTAGTVVGLSPAYVEPRVGDVFRIDIRVDDVTALNAVDLCLTYDSAALEVQDAIPVTSGTQIEPGPFLYPDQVRANLASGGAIHYSVDQLWNHPPVSGSGVVATVTFVALQPGTTSVDFGCGSGAHLYDVNGAELTVSAWDGATFDVRPPVTLSGTVLRQGWSAHDRTAVHAVVMGGQFQQPIAQRTVCTDRNGAFEARIPDDFTLSSSSGLDSPNILPPVDCPASPYNPYRTAFIQIFFQNSILAQGWICLNDGDTSLSTLTLPTSDVNGDSVIDINDIMHIIAHFGESAPAVCAAVVPGCPSALPPAPGDDVNGDCRVDILDLVLAASNLGWHGPAPLSTTAAAGR